MVEPYEGQKKAPHRGACRLVYQGSIDTLIPLSACVMVAHSRGERGKGLDAKNNQLVSYFLTLKDNGTGTECGVNLRFAPQKDSSVNKR